MNSTTDGDNPSNGYDSVFNLTDRIQHVDLQNRHPLENELNYDPITLNPFIRKTIYQLRCLEKRGHPWQFCNLPPVAPWNMQMNAVLPSSVWPTNFEQHSQPQHSTEALFHRFSLENCDPLLTFNEFCGEQRSKNSLEPNVKFDPEINRNPDEDFPSSSGQHPLISKSIVKCVLCPYITNNMLILMDHIDTHFSVKTFICIHCYKSFAGHLDLSVHQCPYASK